MTIAYHRLSVLHRLCRGRDRLDSSLVDVWAFVISHLLRPPTTMPSADFSEATKSSLDDSCPLQDTSEISLGKDDRLHCTTIRSTLQPLDGYGLCGASPTRPDCPASYLIPVR